MEAAESAAASRPRAIFSPHSGHKPGPGLVPLPRASRQAARRLPSNLRAAAESAGRPTQPIGARRRGGRRELWSALRRAGGAERRFSSGRRDVTYVRACVCVYAREAGGRASGGGAWRARGGRAPRGAAAAMEPDSVIEDKTIELMVSRPRPRSLHPPIRSLPQGPAPHCGPEGPGAAWRWLRAGPGRAPLLPPSSSSGDR